MATLFRLLCAFALLLTQSAAHAGTLAPLCQEPAALDAPRSCLVAATFPAVNHQLCFDPSGPAPEVCIDREAMLPIGEDGSFAFEGKRYLGAPAGTAHVGALRLMLGASEEVSVRGTRPNGSAPAADIFTAPPAPQPVSPKAFTPQEAAPLE